jgi:hypothetical protein
MKDDFKNLFLDWGITLVKFIAVVGIIYGLYWIKGIEVKTEDFALSVAGCALIFTFLNETRQNRKNKE